MTQKEIDEALDAMAVVFDKTQEIVNVMQTLNIKQISYLKSLYTMALERININQLLMEESNDK